jgi:hypothetical protein
VRLLKSISRTFTATGTNATNAQLTISVFDAFLTATRFMIRVTRSVKLIDLGSMFQTNLYLKDHVENL